MWTSLNNCFDIVLSKGLYNGSKAIYREELNKKPSPPKKLKKDDSAGNKQPLLLKEEDDREKVNTLERRRGYVTEEKGVNFIRVKVKMTKEDAARLMSKCKDGGVLGFRDVANELAQIPVNRVSVVSCSGGPGYGGPLKSIPEEE